MWGEKSTQMFILCVNNIKSTHQHNQDCFLCEIWSLQWSMFLYFTSQASQWWSSPSTWRMDHWTHSLRWKNWKEKWRFDTAGRKRMGGKPPLRFKGNVWAEYLEIESALRHIIRAVLNYFSGPKSQANIHWWRASAADMPNWDGNYHRGGKHLIFQKGKCILESCL